MARRNGWRDDGESEQQRPPCRSCAKSRTTLSTVHGPARRVVADNVASFARAGVIARIKHVLVTVSGVPLERMVESSRLEQDLELDSLERVGGGMALEEEFGIALSDDEVDQTCMGTIGGIADYLMTQRGVA
jgi:acyl carrier protein